MIIIRILFISSDYPTPKKGSNIYTDLAKALRDANHDIKVVVAEEKKKIKNTTLAMENGIPVLRVKIGNLYEIGFVEKGITILTLGQALKKSIKKFFKNEKFDLILFESPPLTLFSVVKWAMKKYHAPSYLMMKDIFPQNGVDIGLYSKNSPIYKYFRLKEKKLYKTATKIGCMSQGNINYLLNHNKFLKKEKLELFPNTVDVNNVSFINRKDRKNIRRKYNIGDDDVIAIYGGNFGKPQGLDFILDIIESYKDNNKVKFLLIGRGTEKERIFNKIKNSNYNNVFTYDYMPRDDYEKLSKSCDIGLIFLDKRFTVPNYPSKTLSYFASSIPIMAAIDRNTDYNKLIDEKNVGFWVENGDLNSFKKKFDKLINDKELRNKMGKNGLECLKNDFDVNNSVKIIERFVGGKE